MNLPLRLVTIVLFMLGGAFFAGMETGVIAVNRLRLHHLVQHRVPGATLLERFLARPELLLGTTLTGTNLCYVAISVLAASLATDLVGRAGPWIASLLSTVGILVFCEYLPKSWFQGFPAHRTLPFARPLWAASRVLAPLSFIVTRTVGLLMPGGASADGAAEPRLTRDELLHLTREGEQTGALTPAESRMIHGVFELGGKTCGEIMVPRERMICVNHDRPADDLLAMARERSVSRFPVLHAGDGRFVGIVNIFDVLADAGAGARQVRDYMGHPQFTAAGTQVDRVLPRMRVTRQPMMLVTDERFEVVGLVTLDDVLDEIVGYV